MRADVISALFATAGVDKSIAVELGGVVECLHERNTECSGRECLRLFSPWAGNATRLDQLETTDAHAAMII